MILTCLQCFYLLRQSLEFDRAVRFKKEHIDLYIYIFNLYHLATSYNKPKKYDYAIENIVRKVENAGKEALKDMNILKTIASLALKGCLTFLGHFLAHDQAFGRCTAS